MEERIIKEDEFQLALEKLKLYVKEELLNLDALKEINQTIDDYYHSKNSEKGKEIFEEGIRELQNIILRHQKEIEFLEKKKETYKETASKVARKLETLE
ncbi:MAG TPA: hypothetical protein IAC24_00650 [Candidatus Onthousia faecigallinarum]|nr:hypothetical protein [Candidatus Onthousia faecigallinarum]